MTDKENQTLDRYWKQMRVCNVIICITLALTVVMLVTAGVVAVF